MGKRVAIVSAFRGYGDLSRNYAIACLKDSLERGESPFVGHLFYPLALDDNIPRERIRGILAGQDWIMMADLMAVYTDLPVSPGMEADIDWANRHDIKIEYRKLPKEALGLCHSSQPTI